MPTIYNAIIIDDEPIATGIIKNYMDQLHDFNLLGTFTNALEALPILHRETVDLLFLDIEMPGISGIDFAKSLPNRTAVIFTTAYRNYAVDAFDLEVVDYLLKPIPIDRFLKAINRFYNLRSNQNSIFRSPQTTIEVKADKKTYKLNPDEIIFIESVEDYVKIHTNEQRLLVHLRMHQMEEKLQDGFLRIHRSYLINKKHIVAYSSSEIELRGYNLPIGRTFREQVLSLLKS